MLHDENMLTINTIVYLLYFFKLGTVPSYILANNVPTAADNIPEQQWTIIGGGLIELIDWHLLEPEQFLVTILCKHDNCIPKYFGYWV